MSSDIKMETYINNMVFFSKEELLSQLKKDKACLEGIIYCQNKKRTLGEIFDLCPHKWRVWCVARGYIQFLDFLDKSITTSTDSLYILLYQPSYYQDLKDNLSLKHKQILVKKYMDMRI